MALGTLTIAASVSVIKTAAEEGDDDSVKQAAAQLQDVPMGLLIAINLIQMAGYACGLFGALKYNASLVMVAFVFYCIYTVFALIGLNIASILLGGFFAYPHWFLYKEIKDGTMSEENYVNEKASCCCV
mmetsp:Transcript_27839/g.78008  ORF Transcript_27839/g.78008 Transcript_27839/m.78008 type:complete len:129 (-) Transcript_27839:242-628(-)